MFRSFMMELWSGRILSVAHRSLLNNLMILYVYIKVIILDFFPSLTWSVALNTRKPLVWAHWMFCTEMSCINSILFGLLGAAWKHNIDILLPCEVDMVKRAALAFMWGCVCVQLMNVSPILTLLLALFGSPPPIFVLDVAFSHHLFMSFACLQQERSCSLGF